MNNTSDFYMAIESLIENIDKIDDSNVWFEIIEQLEMKFVNHQDIHLIYSAGILLFFGKDFERFDLIIKTIKRELEIIKQTHRRNLLEQ